MISAQSARWFPLVALALAAPVGCGSSIQPPTSAVAPSRTPADSSADGEAVTKRGRGDRETDALIDQMLAGLPGGDHAPARKDPPAPSAVRAPAPAAPASPATPPPSARSGANSADSFDEDVKRIRETVPTWDNGTGITARFLSESSGDRMSLIYVDTTPPEFNAEGGYWVIQAKAKVNGQIVGHVLFLLKSLAPGRYEGSAQKKDVALGSLVGSPTWVGRGPDTSWSMNEGGWVEIVLREGRSHTELEGNFRAKLVANDGRRYQTVESGYFYIKR